MRSAIALVTAAVLAGCQPTTERPEFEVPTSRTYQQEKEAVWRGVLVYLEEAGVAVVQEDFASGLLLAAREDFENEDWAWCERAWVWDHDRDRRRRARPLDRDLALEVQLRERDGVTEVELASEFTEEQIDPFRNLPRTQRCISTGVLEQELLMALES